MKLLPSESILTGRWVVSDGRVVADATTNRIHWLIENALKMLGTDTSGWDVLYRDDADGRLWELTYPQSDSHGGGPPQLTVVEPEQAKAKYIGVFGSR